MSLTEAITKLSELREKFGDTDLQLSEDLAEHGQSQELDFVHIDFNVYVVRS